MTENVRAHHVATQCRPRVGARIDASALAELLAGPTAPRVLDVRSAAEFEAVHLPGSYNVPIETLREHRDELVRHLDEDVVLLCRSGNRAVQAERLLAEHGLSNLHVLEGGIVAWEAAGGEVRRGAARWDIERQVRLVAGSIVLGSVAGSVLVPELKWLAGGVGLGLAAAAVTNSCVMGQLLARLPYNRGASCDLDTIVGQLTDPARR